MTKTDLNSAAFAKICIDKRLGQLLLSCFSMWAA